MMIRSMNSTDYPAAFHLWEECRLPLGESDTATEIDRFLARNPDTCLVAVRDERLIGTVLGGFDGRRGLIHHLAVHPGFQRQGVGRRLMAEVENRFHDLGVVKVSLWIRNDNRSVVAFYRQLGYELRQDIITMSRFM
jgi:ribosomal protein S18 acetylase RimI-like enzyme